MKIYLAGGFSVMCVREREKELFNMINYHRLYSYYFCNEKKIVLESFNDLITIYKEENEIT